ncbi:MAG: transposase [Microcoleaceae cyanobacterium]
MIVYEFKVKGKPHQYQAIDEAILTAQFIRNSCLRYWMDNRGLGRKELYRYNTELRAMYPFARDLNSHACQASVERCWSAIARFFENCKRNIPGKKAENAVLGSPQMKRFSKTGYPKFKKRSRSVEYKTSGWKLLDPKHIEFIDKKGIGKLKLVGTWNLAFYPVEKIKRVRLVRRADGYYCQFCISVDVKIDARPTKHNVGLDVGLKQFYTDSDGYSEPNPKFYRQGEKRLKFHQRRVSRKHIGSANRLKAINRLGREHLKISRQRKEHALKLARCVILSNDMVAYEDLRVRNLVKNHCLAKSINDAGWYQFRTWLEYFGNKFGKVTVAVNPAYTSQECSNCGAVVKKSLSTRTHICECGCELDRDYNAAINILNSAYRTTGHVGSYASGDLSATVIGDSPVSAT